MKLLMIDLIMSQANGIIRSDNQDIKRNIFQGDSLSPRFFCRALISLSNALNKIKYGYKVFDKMISHLFYMDEDIKFQGLLKTVYSFSNDSIMEYGLEFGQCDLE